MNFFISAQGRGASYAFMVTCEEADVTSRCQPCLKSGFECYIYSVEQSPLGNPGFMPNGGITLRRKFHLYNAHDDFKQEALDIINRLDAHSVESSREYLAIMISEFQRELDVLKGGQYDTQAEMVSNTESSIRSEEGGRKTSTGISGVTEESTV